MESDHQHRATKPGMELEWKLPTAESTAPREIPAWQKDHVG